MKITHSENNNCGYYRDRNYIFKMLIYMVLITLSTVSSNPCFISYDFGRFEKTVALTIKGLPTNLVVNPNNKDLFFTLINLDSLNNVDEQTKMEQYVLRNGTPIKIDNINGQAAAVDSKNNRVFLATDDGLSILNKTDQPQFFGLKDEDIVMLYKPQYNDDLYTIIYPDNEVYKINLKKNEKKKIDDIPCAFILAVDAYDNIYYECNSKYMKVLLKDFHEPIEFVGIGKNAGRALTVDKHNRTILAANDGLYHLSPHTVIARKLMNLDYIPSGIAYDDEDFYVATNGVIYKYSECELNKW